MKIESEQLIQKLKNRTEEILALSHSKFETITEEKLFENTIPGKWSIAECLEHLNLYGDFYLKEIDSAIKRSKPAIPTALYKSGWLGNYFADSMLPKDGMKTMKTFKSKDTSQIDVPKHVLARFIRQQQQLLILLERASSISLSHQKVPTTLGKMIKIRLGDTFRFVINHNWRHFQQAIKVLEKQ